MALIAALPTQARFFFLLLPRLVAGRCTPSRLAGYAIELTASGSRRLGMWCWERAVRQNTCDERMCDAVLELCIRAGHQEAAEEFANRFYDTSGMNPAAAVRLVGNLVLTGGYGPALKVFDRGLRSCDGEIASRSPAPAWDAAPGGPELRALLSAHATHVDGDAWTTFDLELGFAKLCFACSAFETSARLFENAAKGQKLSYRERVAQAYALLRSNRVDRIPRDIGTITVNRLTPSPDPDWPVLLASVLLARNAMATAAIAAEQAFRIRFEGHAELEPMITDCRKIVTCISQLPHTITFAPGPLTEAPPYGEPALRKIFVCGSGWSGSGALYDALAEYDGLAEAPNTPIDRYMNDGTDNEMMFVQGASGLGRLWRSARDQRELSRLDLWDMFRCHVLGSGAVGYSEHKSARVASNLVRQFGARYTRAFRRIYEGFATLPESAPLAQLRSILMRTTEEISVILACPATNPGAGGECVVFNNAVFGPNIDMLEIFRNARAAVVVRDPLDQFVDRRAKDLKHWMSPSRFIPLYRASRETFQSRRALLREGLAQEIREVEFERFVRDAAYRVGVIEWLLDGQVVRRAHHRFEPASSARNIGISARLLTPDERKVLELGLKRWRRA